MKLFFYNVGGYNFGDAIGPDIVKKISGHEIEVIDGASDKQILYLQKKLLTVGSILQFAQPGNIIWGSGIHGHYCRKELKKRTVKKLDIRSVRGPLTRSFLCDNYHIDCPKIYGDPVMLISKLFDNKINPVRKYGIIPHINDIEFILFAHGYENVILPTENWEKVVNFILGCELVISSSLHGLIIAEAFGIPARWLHNKNLPSSSKTEGTFKYNDYYASTNRKLDDWSESIEDAIRDGGKEPITEFDYDKLLNSFPHDFFKHNEPVLIYVDKVLNKYRRPVYNLGKFVKKCIRCCQ